MTETTYPTWTDERVETLKKLWAEGYSCSLISSRLPGFSRNAIIGKVHRMGLPLRGHDKVRSRQPVFRKPKRKREIGMVVVKIETPTWKSIPMPTERDRPATLYTLMDRPDNGCMYFYGDPRQDARGYCGKPREPGIAYCGECARICFDVRTPSERQKARQEREKVAA